jgi:DNA primase
VLGAAKPFVDMLWAREFEASQLDTPERRAAFERRLKEPLGQIRDEATRRHYRLEIDERLGQLFAAAAPAPRNERRPGFSGGGRGAGRSGFGAAAARLNLPLRASPQLARSALLQRAHRENPREAFVLLALASHPDLVLRCVDDIAELALEGPAAERFRQALLDATGEGDFDREAFQRRLQQTRVAEAQAALLAVTGPAERLKLLQTADPESVFDSIHQALVLHRRARTLHSELKAAERALADEATEANFAWMKDVKARLDDVEGTQANADD